MPPMMQMPFPRKPQDIRTPPFLPPGQFRMPDEEEPPTMPQGLENLPPPMEQMPQQREAMQGPPPMEPPPQMAFNSPPPMPDLPIKESIPPPNSELPEAPQLPGKLQAKPRPFNPASDLPPLDVDKMGPVPPPNEELPSKGLQQLQDDMELYRHVRRGKPELKPPGPWNRIAAGAMGGLGAAMQLDRNPGMQAIGRQAQQGAGSFLRPGYDRDMARWNQEMKLAEEGIGLSEKVNKAELESNRAKASGDYMKAQSELMRQKPELERNKGTVEITQEMAENYPQLFSAEHIGSRVPYQVLQQAMKNSGFAAMNESKEDIAKGKNETTIKVAGLKNEVEGKKLSLAEKLANQKDATIRWVAEQRAKSGKGGGSQRARLQIKPVQNPESGETELAIINLDTGKPQFTGVKPGEKVDWLSKLVEEEKAKASGANPAAKAIKANTGNNVVGGTPKEGDQQIGSKGTIMEYRGGKWITIKAAPPKPK